MKVVAIVQARLSSSRLPKKVLADISGQPMLYHIIQRLKRCSMLDDIIVATSDNEDDNLIAETCKMYGVNYFRGSLTDVLDRFHKCAIMFNADIVVRITADCPLICPRLIDNNIKIFLENNYDIVSPRSKDGLIRGLDNEVFSAELISKIAKKKLTDDEREHVTLHIYNNPTIYKIRSPKIADYYKYDIRLAVDEIKDLELIRKIYDELYMKGEIIDIQDVINLAKNKPELAENNREVKQIHFD